MLVDGHYSVLNGKWPMADCYNPPCCVLHCMSCICRVVLGNWGVREDMGLSLFDILTLGRVRLSVPCHGGRHVVCRRHAVCDRHVSLRPVEMGKITCLLLVGYVGCRKSGLE